MPEFPGVGAVASHVGVSTRNGTWLHACCAVQCDRASPRDGASEGFIEEVVVARAKCQVLNPCLVDKGNEYRGGWKCKDPVGHGKKTRRR